MSIVYNGTYCIYCHVNRINGKKYIGLTVHGNKPTIRWGSQGIGYHDSKFGRAIKKYGWNNFSHEIVASNLTKEEADNFERLLILKLGTWKREVGYNTDLGGNSLGSLSEEHKMKIKKANTGDKVAKYNLFGELLTIYNNSEDASIQENIPKTSIQSACNGSSKTCHKYIWRYFKKEPLPLIEVGNLNNGNRQILQYDISGNLIAEYISMQEAHEKTGVGANGISHCCRGKQKTAMGYIWRYKN